MVGIKKSFTVIGIFIPFFAIFLMSQNTNAYSFYQNNPNFMFQTTYIERPGLSSSNINWVSLQASTGTPPFTILTPTSLPATDGYWRIATGGNVNAVDISNSNYKDYNTVYANLTLKSENGNVSGFNSFPNESFRTKMNVVDTNGNTSSGTCNITKPNINQLQLECTTAMASYSRPRYLYVQLGTPYSTQLPATPIFQTVRFSSSSRSGDIVVNFFGWGFDAQDSPSTAYLSQITAQNNQIINQNNTIINQDKEFYDSQYESVDNISDQSTSDIDGATNQQTTNLIGVITTFLSTITNIQATNCRMRLQFPEFAGGSQLVDICQYKDKFSGIVSLGSNLMLILLFVPLAFLLLRMIYNEIRSWTNG